MKNQHGGTLIGLAFGLVVGVLISFGVVWYLNKTPLPFVDKVTKPEGAADPKAAGTPLALPGKPGDKPLEKPAERKFEFYDILEGKKGATPSPAAGTPPTPPAPAENAAVPKEIGGSGALYLQAGAFQKAGDAENLKAKLAMLGFEAAVIPAELPDKGKMHRVRIGPYAAAEEMNRARSQLSQHGIPAAVVRVQE